MAKRLSMEEMDLANRVKIMNKIVWVLYNMDK